MSKKSKRLEKDNEGLRRQKEATNANIIRMAEERQDYKKKAEASMKELSTARGIITAMQKQGRAVPSNMASTLDSSCFSDSHGGGEGDEDSDYSDDGEEEDLSEFDDDTEEENQSAETAQQYGPERPPPQPQQQQQQAVNGN